MDPSSSVPHAILQLVLRPAFLGGPLARLVSREFAGYFDANVTAITISMDEDLERYMQLPQDRFAGLKELRVLGVNSSSIAKALRDDVNIYGGSRMRRLKELAVKAPCRDSGGIAQPFGASCDEATAAVSCCGASSATLPGEC